MPQHNRRSIRLKGYDYSLNGLYFITICTQNRIHQFGEIQDGKMILNANGYLIESIWKDLAVRYTTVILHTFVIMPNHIHGIIQINRDNGVGATALPRPETDLTEGRGRTHAPTIGNIVAAFKSISTKKYNEKNDVPGFKLWQRNYFEHVIRNDKSYQLISNYIVTNPVTWSSDCMNRVNSD